MKETVPVLLFAYARPDHLRKTLECLRENQIPSIYAFSDGAKFPEQQEAVKAVRRTLHAIDWCDCILTESETNLGLGQSILNGVSTVLKKEDKVLVFEDDLVCVPGTYHYLSSALEHYKEDPRVMSVTGWTHPSITPSDVVHQPYFDGRAECWVWGTWARAWKGMEETARSLMTACEKLGIDVYRYGADLPQMAKIELDRNIWAVRFLYLHILHSGLCLRPPQTLVEHIGFDTAATNATAGGKWATAPLKACPQIPDHWPEPIENPRCPRLWQKAYAKRPASTRSILRVLHKGMKGVKKTGELIFHRLER